jgi:hypothetical protein
MMEIIKLVQEQLASQGDTAAAKFKRLCEALERYDSQLSLLGWLIWM